MELNILRFDLANTMYNINGNNNSFEFITNGTAVSLNIPAGNYNIKSFGFVVDITDEQAIKDNVDLLIKKFGNIDGLVNNAANNPKVEQFSDVNFSRLESFPLNTWNEDI